MEFGEFSTELKPGDLKKVVLVSKNMLLVLMLDGEVMRDYGLLSTPNGLRPFDGVYLFRFRLWLETSTILRCGLYT